MPMMPFRDIDPKTIAEALRTPSPYAPLILDFIPRERWPCTVSYDHRGAVYVSCDAFRFPPERPGPSDCVWIVPGTAP